MDSIDQIRAFNRDWTVQLGLLSDNFLGTGTNLTDLRVFYELAEGEITARELAALLEIDEGYLSRTLKRFDRKGWITREPSESDGRRRILRLTDAGRAYWNTLVQKSRTDVQNRLKDTDADHIAKALHPVRQMLSASEHPVSLRDLEIGDAGWLIQQHAELYATAEGFDETFEPLVAEILADFIRNHDPTCERAWIATRNGERLGSIFCVRQDETTAKLRLFLLVPWARGLGLGKMLLNECMGYAREKGYARMQLWTHESHRAACALYESHGFELIDSKPVHSFGCDLIEQTWAITL